MAAQPIGNLSFGADKTGSQSDSLRNLNLDDFLKLMITELQNQDPLNPMENDQILQQISQIREIEATTGLTDTLDEIHLGQELSASSALLGRTISGLTDDGEEIEGVVEKVMVADGVARLDVGGRSVRLGNVSAIVPTAE